MKNLSIGQKRNIVRSVLQTCENDQEFNELLEVIIEHLEEIGDQSGMDTYYEAANSVKEVFKILRGEK